MIYTKVNLMCPTYYRAQKLTRFIVSAQKMCNNRNNIFFTFCVNISDKATAILINDLCDGWDYRIIYEDLPQPNLAAFYNKLYKYATFNEHGTIITMLGDDMEFRTKGYDTFFIEKVNEHDGIGIFCGNDRAKRRGLCTMIFTTQKFINYNWPELFMNELFPVDVTDRLWRDTAEALGCFYYYSEITIMHHHSKKDRDSTYLRLREQAHITRENEKGYADILEKQIERIGSAMNPVIEETVIPVFEGPITVQTFESKTKTWNTIKKVEQVVEKVIKKPIQKAESLKPPPKTVLFALMGRYGDIILGSFIANMLIDKGFQVTWLTIPYYEELIKIVCEKAKVICIDYNSDWQQTDTQEMRIKHFGYDYYINAQIGSKEYHNDFISSRLHPAWFIKNIVEKEMKIKLSKKFLNYARIKPLKRIVIDRNKPLAIIAPETGSVISAITKDIIEKNYNKYKDKYCVKILVENPDLSDDRYIYGYTFIECISLLQQTALFIGNDSGLVWASLFNPQCRKIIYHVRKRVEETNISFSKLDNNAEDIVLEVKYLKEQEVEYKRKKRK